MHDFQDAPLVGPGSELQLTREGGARLHEHVVGEALLEPAAVITAELVAELEVGEEAAALELDAGPRARGAGLSLAAVHG